MNPYKICIFMLILSTIMSTNISTVLDINTYKNSRYQMFISDSIRVPLDLTYKIFIVFDISSLIVNNPYHNYERLSPNIKIRLYIYEKTCSGIFTNQFESQYSLCCIEHPKKYKEFFLEGSCINILENNLDIKLSSSTFSLKELINDDRIKTDKKFEFKLDLKNLKLTTDNDKGTVIIDENSIISACDDNNIKFASIRPGKNSEKRSLVFAKNMLGVELTDSDKNDACIEGKREDNSKSNKYCLNINNLTEYCIDNVFNHSNNKHRDITQSQVYVNVGDNYIIGDSEEKKVLKDVNILSIRRNCEVVLKEEDKDDKFIDSESSEKRFFAIPLISVITLGIPMILLGVFLYKK